MPAADDVTTGILHVILGAISGFVAALMTWRTRLALAEQANAERWKRFDEWQRRVERRSQVTLELMVDLASKSGVDKRLTDGLVKYLAETSIQD